MWFQQHRNMKKTIVKHSKSEFDGCTILYNNIPNTIITKYPLKINKNSKSGYAYVHPTSGSKYQTQIYINGKHVHQGIFVDVKTASLVYSIAKYNKEIGSVSNEALKELYKLIKEEYDNKEVVEIGYSESDVFVQESVAAPISLVKPRPFVPNPTIASTFILQEPSPMAYFRLIEHEFGESMANRNWCEHAIYLRKKLCLSSISLPSYQEEARFLYNEMKKQLYSFQMKK